MSNQENQQDAVDLLIQQWREERPDLDLKSMATIGRLKRCTSLVMPRLNKAFAEFDITSWEFDVLATLRRSGAPYTLAPTSLFSSLMITSGTMTHRIKSLEARGFVEREDNPDDARSKLVKLSSVGLDLIDRAVERHVENERNLLSKLSDSDLTQLDLGLKGLLTALEGN